MALHFHITWSNPHIVEHVHPYAKRHVHEALVECTSSRRKAEKLLVQVAERRRKYLEERRAYWDRMSAKEASQ